MNAPASTVICSLAALAMLAASGTIVSQPILIWNASESVPIGLYRLRPITRWYVTELVAVRPVEPLAAYLDRNGHLPAGLPMLKRILALPGQTVCRKGLSILVDDVEVGAAEGRDARGRPLPDWQGCTIVGDGQLFLMNWQSETSLDGRYFGLMPASSVIGRAVPVWTRED